MRYCIITQQIKLNTTLSKPPIPPERHSTPQNYNNYLTPTTPRPPVLSMQSPNTVESGRMLKIIV
jgi:hypothetical protein